MNDDDFLNHDNLDQNIANNRKEYTNLEAYFECIYNDEVHQIEIWKTQKFELTALELEILEYDLPIELNLNGRNKKSKGPSKISQYNKETILSSKKLLDKRENRQKINQKFEKALNKFYEQNIITVENYQNKNLTFDLIQPEIINDYISSDLSVNFLKKNILRNVAKIYEATISISKETNNSKKSSELFLVGYFEDFLYHHVFLKFVKYWNNEGSTLATSNPNYIFHYLPLETLIIISLKYFGPSFRSMEIKKTLENLVYYLGWYYEWAFGLDEGVLEKSAENSNSNLQYDLFQLFCDYIFLELASLINSNNNPENFKNMQTRLRNRKSSPVVEIDSQSGSDSDQPSNLVNCLLADSSKTVENMKNKLRKRQSEENTPSKSKRCRKIDEFDENLFTASDDDDGEKDNDETQKNITKKTTKKSFSSNNCDVGDVLKATDIASDPDKNSNIKLTNSKAKMILCNNKTKNKLTDGNIKAQRHGDFHKMIERVGNSAAKKPNEIQILEEPVQEPVVAKKRDLGALAMVEPKFNHPKPKSTKNSSKPKRKRVQISSDDDDEDETQSSSSDDDLTPAEKEHIKNNTIVDHSNIQKYPELNKYWAQRKRYFSKYNKGIKLDYEMWFSVTPECIAKHVAQQCGRAYFQDQIHIIDAFCGAGGNAIQFAALSDKVKVTAIDINNERLETARHNARIYNVEKQITFICGSFMEIAPTLRKHDVCFLSPPWGGPEYTKRDVYKFAYMPIDYKKMILWASKLSSSVIHFVPKNSDAGDCLELCRYFEVKKVRMEKQYFGRKFKTLSCYYGKLANV